MFDNCEDLGVNFPNATTNPTFEVKHGRINGYIQHMLEHVHIGKFLIFYHMELLHTILSQYANDYQFGSFPIHQSVLKYAPGRL